MITSDLPCPSCVADQVHFPYICPANYLLSPSAGPVFPILYSTSRWPHEHVSDPGYLHHFIAFMATVYLSGAFYVCQAKWEFFFSVYQYNRDKVFQDFALVKYKFP